MCSYILWTYIIHTYRDHFYLETQKFENSVDDFDLQIWSQLHKKPKHVYSLFQKYFSGNLEMIVYADGTDWSDELLTVVFCGMLIQKRTYCLMNIKRISIVILTYDLVL